MKEKNIAIKLVLLLEKSRAVKAMLKYHTTNLQMRRKNGKLKRNFPLGFRSINQLPYWEACLKIGPLRLL